MKRFVLGFRIIAVISIALMLSTFVFSQEQPCATASKFGAGDQIGKRYLDPMELEIDILLFLL